MTEYSGSRILDVKGTACPYPQLKTKVTLDQMNVGEVLKVLTDDRTTADNIRLAVEQLGDTILGIEDGEKEIILIIQKAERGPKSTLKMKLSK